MRYKILNILALVTLASCTETIYIEKDAEKSPYLNGECKTPIAVGISYNEGSVQTRATRAANGSFTSGDNLIAYVRHVTAEESGTGTSKTYTKIKDVNTGSIVGVGPTMGYLTVSDLNESSKNEADNFSTSGKSKLTVSDKEGKPLYWDDFSNSASDDTDLRTSGHYLQSYYGYCYNGKTGVIESETATGTWLKPSTGELTGWTIQTNQNTGTNLTNSDLLWSSSQDPVPYAHATFDGGVDHGILTIPYSHAMSKVTIEVKVADGFEVASSSENKNFDNASVKLVGVNTKCTLNAPEGKINTLSATSTTENPLIMQKGTVVKADTEDSKKCTFEAIIAPSLIKEGNDFAIIEGIDGNKYVVNLSDEIIDAKTTGESPTTKDDAWSKKLATNAAEITSTPAAYKSEEGGITLPGVNYKLVVTISKQEIKVEAKIADWEQVNAESTAEIKFTTDITNYTNNPEKYPSDKIKTFNSGDLIDLYKTAKTTQTPPTFTTRSSIAAYTTAEKDAEGNITTPAYWTCVPVLYWDKEGDKEYFRAIFPTNSTTGGRTITDNKFDITAGEGSSYDVLWGTTAEHTTKKIDGTDGTSYDEGVAIDPRTKDVPLIFYHKTSKVKIVLQTPPTDADGKVTLKEVDGESAKYAKIQFTNLYTTNTVDLHSGVISAFTESSSRSEKVFEESTRPEAGTYQPGNEATETAPAVDDKAETDDLFMIPQDITDDSRLIITLSDGTTYSLQLNACKTIVEEGGTPTEVKKWEEGKSYVYYIHLTKEAVQFIAVIQNWEEHSTSGSASMDWDDVDPDLFEGGLIETRKDGWKI